MSDLPANTKSHTIVELGKYEQQEHKEGKCKAPFQDDTTEGLKRKRVCKGTTMSRW